MVNLNLMAGGNKNKVLLAVFLVLCFLTVIIFGLSYQKQKTNIPVSPPLSSPQPATAVPTRIEQIPFDYEVVSVSADQAVLKGEKGEATLPNNPDVKVFQGLPVNALPVSFSNLAAGQKVKIERTISQTVQEVRVYILP